MPNILKIINTFENQFYLHIVRLRSNSLELDSKYYSH